MCRFCNFKHCEEGEVCRQPQDQPLRKSKMTDTELKEAREKEAKEK